MNYDFILVLLIMHGVYWLVMSIENAIRRNRKPRIKKYSMSKLSKRVVKISF